MCVEDALRRGLEGLPDEARVGRGKPEDLLHVLGLLEDLPVQGIPLGGRRREGLHIVLWRKKGACVYKCICMCAWVLVVFVNNEDS